MLTVQLHLHNTTKTQKSNDLVCVYGYIDVSNICTELYLLNMIYF